MTADGHIIDSLPDADAARRFLERLEAENPSQFKKLISNEPLFSDVAAITAFSPLLATTLLQHPEYIAWLDRERKNTAVRSKEELLESLGRFSLTNSQLEPQTLYARFRRRELLRIFLRDIRGLATIAEITEEISNLADAILEAALQLALNEADSRFGMPQETDEKGRVLRSTVCIAALGKLGSRELNYSSDIDLVFFYSGEGTTAGGSRGSVTNREYFVKLAELTTKMVSGPGSEGAYRVDLRLRPHGTMGPIAMSLADTVRYYETEARPWERQVLIRSRSSAGDGELFRRFFSEVEDLVFVAGQSVGEALENVRLSKERIDAEAGSKSGYNVKLGRGGIREIEFIAQALQLAYGGDDQWLRTPHTLISLARLAERGHITQLEHSELAAAYTYLRQLEHILQMENGLQTHVVPDDAAKQNVISDRMTFAMSEPLGPLLEHHTANVKRIFDRVLGSVETHDRPSRSSSAPVRTAAADDPARYESPSAALLREKAPFFADYFASLGMIDRGEICTVATAHDEYAESLANAVREEERSHHRITQLRAVWNEHLYDIVSAECRGDIDISEVKRRLTLLAEASIDAALLLAEIELQSRGLPPEPACDIAVLALGKLGGRGMDYHSDLDLVLVFEKGSYEEHAKAVELFINALSAMTRNGRMYRVDLRLRPYGSKGLIAMPADAFLEYLETKAEIWEYLAFVKLRAAGGDRKLGESVEKRAREIIHRKSLECDPEEQRIETIRIRKALESRARTRRKDEIDIKYGEGGLLDVYFATRYLQLRYNIPDTGDDRSTGHIIDRLINELPTDSGVSRQALETLRRGHSTLSRIDHHLRLTAGRTTRVPSGNYPEFAGSLLTGRIEIREAFDELSARISETGN
jgi:glutamate-ammonia-ligase adenylyltransferase